jgi:hypothetical protein
MEEFYVRICTYVCYSNNNNVWDARQFLKVSCAFKLRSYKSNLIRILLRILFTVGFGPA